MRKKIFAQQLKFGDGRFTVNLALLICWFLGGGRRYLSFGGVGTILWEFDRIITIRVFVEIFQALFSKTALWINLYWTED